MGYDPNGIDLPWIDHQFISAIAKEPTPEHLTRGIDGETFRKTYMQVINYMIGTNVKLYHARVRFTPLIKLKKSSKIRRILQCSKLGVG